MLSIQSRWEIGRSPRFENRVLAPVVTVVNFVQNRLMKYNQAPKTNPCILQMAILLLAVVVTFSSGCSYFSPEAWRSQKKTVSSKDELILRVTLDKTAYRPNEAVVMEVTITNTTSETIQIAKLDSSSASFFYGVSAEDRRVERFPVVSSLEEADLKRRGSEIMQLQPGKKHSRKFVHTRLTRDPGSYTAQVHAAPFLDITDHRTGKLYSNFAPYEVAGEPIFARDNMGLMMAEDAVRIAKEKVQATQGEVFATDHILAEDQTAGFYAWWVNLDYKLPDGSAYRTSYIVDPYTGVVKDKANPFPDSMKPKAPVSDKVPKPEPKPGDPSE